VRSDVLYLANYRCSVCNRECKPPPTPTAKLETKVIRDSYLDLSGSRCLSYLSQNCGCIISSASVISPSMVQIGCWLYENWENSGLRDRFNSKIPRAQFFYIISYFGFIFTSAYSSILFCCLPRNVEPCYHAHDLRSCIVRDSAWSVSHCRLPIWNWITNDWYHRKYSISKK